MNLIEITLNQPGDNETHLRADVRCKWTPFSLHFLTLHNYNLLDIGPESPTNKIADRWESTRNKPYSHNTPNRRVRQPFVTLKNYRTLEKRKNLSLDDLLDCMDKNFERFNEVSHISILHAFGDLYDIWTKSQVPLAASCYELSPGDRENWVERSIWPKCKNSPQFEATATWKLENSH